MENKILEDLKAKLKSLQSKINSKNEKIENKNEEIKSEKSEIQRVEKTRKGDDPKFEAFNEMVDEDIKNRNKRILQKEKEIEQEKENIIKIEEEKKTAIENAKSEVKKDSTKKLVKINKLNNEVKGLKESARKIKEAKLATTNKTVYKVNDEEHKAKIAEIKEIYKKKNGYYKEYQENQKALTEIEKIEKEELGKSSIDEKDKTPKEEKTNKEEKGYIPEMFRGDESVIVPEGPEQVEPVQGGQEGPEQGEPVQGGQEGPEQGDPVQGDPVQGDPVQGDPDKGKSTIDMLLVMKVAEKLKIDLTDKDKGADNLLKFMNLLEKEAKFDGMTAQDKLEELGQEFGIIPKLIYDIIINEDEYVIKYGNKEKPKTKAYQIGSDIPIDRESKDEILNKIAGKYNIEDKKVLRRLDIGLLKILDENQKCDDELMRYNKIDKCKEYIGHVKDNDRTTVYPRITYDLEYAKNLTAAEVFVRNNARKNKQIAEEVLGLTKNPIIRAYDFIQEKAENISRWFGEKVKLLGTGKNKENIDKEVEDSQGQNDLAQENNEPSFREGIYNKEAAEKVVIVGQSAGARAQENAEPVILSDNENVQENDEDIIGK